MKSRNHGLKAFKDLLVKLERNSIIKRTTAMISLIILFLLPFSGNYLFAQTTYSYSRPNRATLLAALNAKNPNHEHPRLYARSADFDTIRKKVVSDPQMKSWYEDILKSANRVVNIDTIPYAYEPIYVSPPISRSVPGRLYALSMAYQITQKQKYADRVIKELEAIADWPNWGIRPNFLSVADIMHAFSVGYDWCYAAMTPAQRTVFRNAIVNKGLKKMIDEYNTNPTYAYKNKIGNVFGNNNWNPWCNGAASACALAIGDEEPVVAGEVLERALVIVENFAGTYGPDGASVEGPGYGNGAMSFYIKWIATMESALGTSYNYFNVPGIPEYVYFTPYLNGPVKALNFHDAGNDDKKYMDVTFFIANKLHKPTLGNMRKNDIQSGNTKGGFFDILWYKPDNYGDKTESLPLDKYFGGLVQTGSFRSSFTEPNAIFLAFHGGENAVAHSHLDIGQFNIDAMGLNWALDLGTEPLTYNPSFKNTFNLFGLYRLNPGGHNTLLINPSAIFDGQSNPAYNPVTQFVSKPSGGFAIVDMTKAYQTQANSAKRGFSLTKNRSKIIIQDELDLKQVSDVWWFMHTRATIKISEDGKTAILTQQGKRMRASLVSPAQGKFLLLESEPLPETYQNANQTPNTGIQKLAVKVSGVQKTTIMIELIPILQNSDLSEVTLPLVPLNKWNEPQLSSNKSFAQVKEPYKPVHNGYYSGFAVKESPDPLITYHWNNPKATDSLELYTLQPKKITGIPNSSFKQNKNQITVSGKGSLLFDFGVESAGWMEFDSDDLVDSVEVSISEYNEPAILNAGAKHRIKTQAPVKYGNTYRLELNDFLYEGVRFAWIHVRNFSKTWHIKNVRLVCQVRPVNYLGSFSCSDAELTRIWYTGAYVVKLNLLQDYFGAILMERSDRHSWTGDAYPAQAAALAAFGNYDVIKKNIAYTSSQDNGIAAYSLYWVLSLIDYLNYTGDVSFFKEYAGNADKRLEKAYNEYDKLPKLGFMGWDERLGAGFENPQTQEAQNTYKMLCINAWKQFGKTMSLINETGMAIKYQQFATSKIKLMLADESMLQHYGIHAVSEAVNAGLSDHAIINKLSTALFADRLNRLSYSPFNQYFIIQAMASAKQYDAALTTIKDCWGGQLRYGGTTFFEVYRPSWNAILNPNDAPPNNQCGYTSLAHPWSAGVTKWLSENILGIKPVQAGFKSFTIIPFLEDKLTQVKGAMPTPFGAITADFNMQSGNCTVSIPQGTSAEKIGLPKAGKQISKVMINGKLLWDGVFHQVTGIIAVEEDNNYLYLIHVKSGNYKLQVTYTGANELLKNPTEKFNYLITSIKQDSITSGNWNSKYGKQGYVLFGYSKEVVSKQLPAYVDSLTLHKNGIVVWNSLSSDTRVLAAFGMAKKSAAAIITKDPDATYQTMTMDIALRENHSYYLSMYFLDWDKQDRRSAIEIFDLETLNIIAPVEMVRNYEQGKYVSFTFNKSVRIRINHVRGKNAAVSGVFFDKP